VVKWYSMKKYGENIFHPFRIHFKKMLEDFFAGLCYFHTDNLHKQKMAAAYLRLMYIFTICSSVLANLYVCAFQIVSVVKKNTVMLFLVKNAIKKI